MSEAKKPLPNGSDWTRLLTDPDLVSHLNVLLQTYREVPPERREAALLEVMRDIKEEAARSRQAKASSHAPAVAQTAPAAPDGSTKPEPAPLPSPQPVTVTPPPDLFTPSSGSDRRRFARMKCYFAVEIHVEGIEEPVWGNLSNVSRGGCLVETAGPVPPGKALEIGLWVSSGKLWVKGVVINGIATRSSSSFGLRVQFSEEELSEKEHLREFLKFVENSTRKAHSGNAYMAGLKS